MFAQRLALKLTCFVLAAILFWVEGFVFGGIWAWDHQLLGAPPYVKSTASEYTDCVNPFPIEGGGALVFSFKLLHNVSQS